MVAVRAWALNLFHCYIPAQWHCSCVLWENKKKVAGSNAATEEKKKLLEKEAAEKDKEVSVSLLNIKVGLIRKSWKHPSADRYAVTSSLSSFWFPFFLLKFNFLQPVVSQALQVLDCLNANYGLGFNIIASVPIQSQHFVYFVLWCSLLVEEIDVGEAKLRQVVSGLAKYCSPEELTVCTIQVSVRKAFALNFCLLFRGHTFIFWRFSKMGLSDVGSWCLESPCCANH